MQPLGQGVLRDSALVLTWIESPQKLPAFTTLSHSEDTFTPYTILLDVLSPRPDTSSTVSNVASPTTIQISVKYLVFEKLQRFLFIPKFFKVFSVFHNVDFWQNAWKPI